MFGLRLGMTEVLSFGKAECLGGTMWVPFEEKETECFAGFDFGY